MRSTSIVILLIIILLVPGSASRAQVAIAELPRVTINSEATGLPRSTLNYGPCVGPLRDGQVRFGRGKVTINQSKPRLLLRNLNNGGDHDKMCRERD